MNDFNNAQPTPGEIVAGVDKVLPEQPTANTGVAGDEGEQSPNAYPTSLPVMPITGTNRNKQITSDIDVLGDVHLGKRFMTNVPIHRRGEREARVWADLEASLMGTTAKYHVQVGDLFDAFVVPIEVVLRAADIYIAAYAANQHLTQFIVIAGNHDLSRTESRKSSFELFKRLVEPISDIHVYTQVSACDSLGFIPWHPFKTAAELAVDLYQPSYEVVFGHWDCKSFGGDDHNLIPLAQLAGKTKLVVTGHEHNPREFDQDGIHVVVAGSMQPYTHAEDPTGEFYTTMTLDELAACDEDLSNRNVRLVLKEGEVIPAGIDALSVTTKTVEAENSDVVKEVDFDPSFDLKTLLADALSEAGVESTLTAKIQEKFSELRAGE